MSGELEVADIPVVILCGGLGTRLREVTENVPKPLVDIGGRPILWHIMKRYDSYGFRKFVLCLGYRSVDIKSYFLRYRENLADFRIKLRDDHTANFLNGVGNEDWEVTCAETGLLTATGGRVRRVRQYVDTPTFALTYGDGIGDVDLAGLLAFHRSHGRAGTVTGVHPTSRYGEMTVQDDQVLSFNEKPQADSYVSGGFFMFEQRFFDYLSDDPSQFFEAEPLGRLALDGELRTYTHDGFWMGMDTFRDYTELNKRWATGDAPWKRWEDPVA